jgi:hypothetical protein
MITFLLGFFGTVFVMCGIDRAENWTVDGWAVAQMWGGGAMVIACAARLWITIEGMS